MSEPHDETPSDPPLSMATIEDIAAELRRRSGDGFGFALFISRERQSLSYDPANSELYSSADDNAEQAWFFGVAISQALGAAAFNNPHLEGRAVEIDSRVRQLLQDLWLIRQDDDDDED